ncbi:MAG: LysM peptidoglycan-binding domain-containing protein [Clostridiales bacterium]|nr:LysM peptidoglycan-binding domain-containing protein [Clostridiales bacterium]
MTDQENREELTLPKNIRQIGTFGEKYRVYIEDFVYTYVHRFLHQKRREDTVLAAVLLGRTIVREEQEYVFISGAQKAEFGVPDGNGELPGGMPDTTAAKQAEFWDRVYQRIKQSFDDLEIVGWYFNLDGSNLEINTQLQQFFESTFKKGSRFLYFEDRLEQNDTFFVQEQHKLQRLSGYAVYYEKNPQMQQFMMEEKERLTPRPIRESMEPEQREDVVQNYRAIMNKLNEKPPKRRWQPVLYAAGAAVLVIVAATAVTQIGNYQNLKTLQQTMQALSGAVSEETVNAEDGGSAEEDLSAKSDVPASADGSTESGDSPASGDAENTAADVSEDTDTGDAEDTAVSAAGTGDTADTALAAGTDDAADITSAADGDTANAGSDSAVSASESVEASAEGGSTAADAAEETASVTSTTAETGDSQPDYYIVQKGDSLLSVSQAVYGSESKVEEICVLNGIEDKDMIYEGQKLLLP